MGLALGTALVSCANSDGGDSTGGGGSSSAEAGTNGRAGATGVAGTNGSVAGTSGAAGTIGTTGAAGAIGAAGANGTAGATGTAGRGGTAGTSGSAGTVGTAGTSGTAGRGGTTGGAGTTGAGGTVGRGGTTGSAGSTGAGGTSGTGTAGTSGSMGALIHNDTFWKDTSGTAIYSQGGGVFKFGGTYYWYGVEYGGAVTYAANPTKKNSDTTFVAVTCYSSTDLVTWKFENNVLTAAGLGANFNSGTWIGRMGVVYNATTKKYVLISQYGSGPLGTGELFATSSTPTGTFTFDHVQTSITNVVNTTTGDQTIFTDDDGSSYLICSSSSGRSNLYVAPIRASDSLNVEPATRIFGGPGREGNTMFKYSGSYYFCSSDLHGWNASHSYYIAASNIMGPYGAEGIIGNTDNDFSHVSQTGFFITVVGTAGTTVIFAGDRWSDFAGNGLGYNQWCPLSFSGTTPTMQSVSEWSLNAAAGTWSVGPDNNYALNPSFEADRVAMTQPAGWTTTTTSSGGITPYTNVSGGHTGNWSWQLNYTAAYQATLNQAVANLPSGTYTLAVWAKSSGGQTTAQLYAKGFGGTEKDAVLTKAMTAFTQVSITGIAVSNGTCQIGITTTAGANQSLTVDDFTFVRTGP